MYINIIIVMKIGRKNIIISSYYDISLFDFSLENFFVYVETLLRARTMFLMKM